MIVRKGNMFYGFSVNQRYKMHIFIKVQQSLKMEVLKMAENKITKMEINIKARSVFHRLRRSQEGFAFQ
jgi:hypothetical protein